MECHAGHGLTYDNVGPVAALPEVMELNIGHFLIGQAILDGMATVIGEMRQRIAGGPRLKTQPARGCVARQVARSCTPSTAV